VGSYVGPLVERGADVVVLGCTHYPFLRPLVEEAAGPGIVIIDPAQAVARQAQRVLTVGGLLRDEMAKPRETYYTSGDAAEFSRVASRLLGRPIEAERVPLLVG
jgi:glutamate racemase